jgi:hypothetical protein
MIPFKLKNFSFINSAGNMETVNKTYDCIKNIILFYKQVSTNVITRC